VAGDVPAPGDPETHTHHLHLTEPGSDLWRERLTFRDTLRSDPALIAQYQQLKYDLRPPGRRRGLTPWSRSGSFGYASCPVYRAVRQTCSVIATVPATVERLLTADVAREIARAYGDRPIYPGQIVIDGPARTRKFPGWPGPVLVLAEENQGACSWGVPLDGDQDRSQVLVGGDLCATVTYAGSVGDFITARRWDYQCVNADFCVAARAAVLDETSLGYLQARCTPSVTTEGWPGLRQYRFEHQDVRVLLWSDTDQCDWLISAASEASLQEFIAGLLSLPSLRAARWAGQA